MSHGVSSFGSAYRTSFFVSTGDPRWSYDPYLFCYYDRYRSCYYDPYLFGYYPVGYRPMPVRGCPHPYNWSGYGACPPPQQIRSTTLRRYDQRMSNYQAANYHWARRVDSTGSPSWLNSSQRSQLQDRASQPQALPPQQTTPSWMNGGLRPTSRSSGFHTSPPPFGQNDVSSESRSRSLRSASQFSNPATPAIEPRPARGGMFDGLNRSTGTRPQADAPSAQLERTPAPRSAPEAPSRSTPRNDSPETTDGANDNSSLGGGASGSSGGGLRRFQR